MGKIINTLAWMVITGIIGWFLGHNTDYFDLILITSIMIGLVWGSVFYEEPKIEDTHH